MERDERTLYMALVLIGMLPLIGAIASGGAAGAGVTVCFLMVAFGIAGVVHETLHRRPPQARIATRRARR